MLKEKERLAYIDPEKSLEEKQLGNSFFQKGQCVLHVAFTSDTSEG